LINEAIKIIEEENRELKSHVRELEAERDRLKEENGNMDSMYQDRLLDMEAKVNLAEENLVLYAKSYDANVEGYQQDIAELRARHAALVEVASKALKCVSANRCSSPKVENILPTKYKEHIVLHDCGKCEWCKLKAALAEVKG
jgi:seryl-tRNA synthetase